MSSLFDPRALLGSAVSITRTALSCAEWTEEQFLALARAGLDAIDPDSPAADDGPAERAVKAEAQRAALEPAPAQRLNERMNGLLDQALNQGTAASRLELFTRILDQLVADEARIVGALSDGAVSPLINVISRTSSRSPVLENAALIGRTANLALPEMVPAYVTNLLNLGLLEVGPEDPDLKVDYEVLAAETMVLKAIKSSSVGPVGPRIERRTLRLSSLGMDLWATAMAAGD
ncbi:DUF4393 domain-containing protein [Gordonia sp. PDNC005]|uniref:Abi-alpha family protein n=1 Tax=unclassified Gordonia (in: high G+C Gram-positive bacteria) TaxID=2657482 RepID=UPI00196460F4|nr:Abi-alpha family protein [Gordonia sp. PDNC005]QRY62656.1 DUF4393 domain-containing protein [Gordonia sp. PDNC005]